MASITLPFVSTIPDTLGINTSSRVSLLIDALSQQISLDFGFWNDEKLSVSLSLSVSLYRLTNLSSRLINSDGIVGRSKERVFERARGRELLIGAINTTRCLKLDTSGQFRF